MSNYDGAPLNTNNRPGTSSVSTDQHLPEKIRNLDLGAIKFKLLYEDSEVDWSEKRVDEVEAEYRRFLALADEGNGRPTSPSRNIDVFWHQHILDTEKYYNDMMLVFGHMMHHFPYLGSRSEEDQELLYEAYRDTRKRYLDKFGELPREDVWGLMAHCGSSHCSGNTGGDGSGGN